MLHFLQRLTENPSRSYFEPGKDPPTHTHTHHPRPRLSFSQREDTAASLSGRGALCCLLAVTKDLLRLSRFHFEQLRQVHHLRALGDLPSGVGAVDGTP
jgi:hypothetical protein